MPNNAHSRQPITHRGGNARESKSKVPLGKRIGQAWKKAERQQAEEYYFVPVYSARQLPDQPSRRPPTPATREQVKRQEREKRAHGTALRAWSQGERVANFPHSDGFAAPRAAPAFTRSETTRKLGPSRFAGWLWGSDKRRAKLKDSITRPKESVQAAEMREDEIERWIVGSSPPRDRFPPPVTNAEQRQRKIAQEDGGKKERRVHFAPTPRKPGADWRAIRPDFAFALTPQHEQEQVSGAVGQRRSPLFLSPSPSAGRLADASAAGRGKMPVIKCVRSVSGGGSGTGTGTEKSVVSFGCVGLQADASKVAVGRCAICERTAALYGEQGLCYECRAEARAISPSLVFDKAVKRASPYPRPRSPAPSRTARAEMLPGCPTNGEQHRPTDSCDGDSELRASTSESMASSFRRQLQSWQQGQPSPDTLRGGKTQGLLPDGGVGLGINGLARRSSPTLPLHPSWHDFELNGEPWSESREDGRWGVRRARRVRVRGQRDATDGGSCREVAASPAVERWDNTKSGFYRFYDEIL